MSKEFVIAADFWAQYLNPSVINLWNLANDTFPIYRIIINQATGEIIIQLVDKNNGAVLQVLFDGAPFGSLNIIQVNVCGNILTVTTPNATNPIIIDTSSLITPAFMIFFIDTPEKSGFCRQFFHRPRNPPFLNRPSCCNMSC